jgi:hypothetical protein
MTFFLIMIASPLIVALSLAVLFWWGAAGKESYTTVSDSAHNTDDSVNAKKKPDGKQ